LIDLGDGKVFVEWVGEDPVFWLSDFAAAVGNALQSNA
jgi:hypothetical protein